jgi:hypothetical protein
MLIGATLPQFSRFDNLIIPALILRAQSLARSELHRAVSGTCESFTRRVVTPADVALPPHYNSRASA